MKPTISRISQSAFTIVELLIVIVVIGILAAITIVAYNGIQSRANITAAQSDLSNLGKRVSLYQADTGEFPVTNATIKQITQDASLWNATRSPASKNFLFCANDTKYSIIASQAPGVPNYAVANATVYYWASDKGVSTYINTTGDANWTPNCTITIGTITWRQLISAVT